MSKLHERVADQFSYRGERAEVWRAFDRFLDTDAYLNLGYSPRFLPHVVGSSQRRLAEVIGDGLAERIGETDGVRLLDVGCGRGGPATVLADAYGFDVTGVDLVPYNVEAARRTAERRASPPSVGDGGADTNGPAGRAKFALGDATRLPIAGDSMGAATAIDSIVYVPDARAAFSEVARVLRPGGVVAVSDLLARAELDGAARTAVDAFADAWDVPGIVPAERYLDVVAAAGLEVETVRDLSPHSVDRLRKWTRLYLGIADRGPGVLERALDPLGVDAERATEQVRAAHGALPHLRHVLVYARRASRGGRRP